MSGTPRELPKQSSIHHSSPSGVTTSILRVILPTTLLIPERISIAVLLRSGATPTRLPLNDSGAM